MRRKAYLLRQLPQQEQYKTFLLSVWQLWVPAIDLSSISTCLILVNRQGQIERRWRVDDGKRRGLDAVEP